MKKIIFLFFMASLSILLIGCDYPEKSFNALRNDDIPIEVTEDFILPRGVYAPFIWTSDSEYIKIEENLAKVTQTDEDITVKITATINKTKRSFDVIVLKKGSITVYEKMNLAKDYLEETYDTINSDKLLMPKELEGIYLRYSNAFSASYISSYIDDNNNTHFSNNFKEATNKEFIVVTYYKDSDLKIRIGSSRLYFDVHPMKENDPYILALNKLNNNNYYYNNGEIIIEGLKKGDVIEFSNKVDAEYLLTYDSKIMEKTAPNKLKLKKDIKEKYILYFGIIIKIDGLEKNVKIKLI